MSKNNTESCLNHYTRLQPEMIMDAIEGVGLSPQLSLLPLNSYENRVYQVAMEEGNPLVVKFYRPDRWSDEQILEEHDFCKELISLEIPVVAPIVLEQKTLHHFNGYRFSLFESKGGRNLEIENLEHLEIMGRLLARIHLLGEKKQFASRPNIDVNSYGWKSLEIIVNSHYIPMGLDLPFKTIAEQICESCETVFSQHGAINLLRLHGDCHPSNVMWTDKGAHFVDFDDARNGPAVQDLWMMITGDQNSMMQSFTALMDGYNDFRSFDLKEIRLLEPLRGLRMLHYMAWLCQRWTDPSFPHNFPWFQTQRYWEDQILELKEQLYLINNPTLELSSFN